METRVAMSENDSLERSDLRIVWSGVSHVGKVRAVNEDSFLACPGMWVVADGMGGHSAGRTASEIMIGKVVDRAGGLPLTLTDVPSMLDQANEEVRQRALADGYDTMGTTVCGVTLVDNGGEDALLVFNVGDSRCYGVEDGGEMEQLTTDHSHVQELVERGEITPQEARSHPSRNVVSRAIGIENSVAADFLLLPRSATSRLLVCSDGVSGELTDETISGILTRADTPADATAALLKEVLSCPAMDNATAVVLDVFWNMSEVPPDDNRGSSETTIPRTKKPSLGGSASDDGGKESAPVIAQIPGFIAAEPDVTASGPLVDRVPVADDSDEGEAG